MDWVLVCYTDSVLLPRSVNRILKLNWEFFSNLLKGQIVSYLTLRRPKNWCPVNQTDIIGFYMQFKSNFRACTNWSIFGRSGYGDCVRLYVKVYDSFQIQYSVPDCYILRSFGKFSKKKYDKELNRKYNPGIFSKC